MTPEQAWKSITAEQRLLITEFIFSALTRQPKCSFCGLLKNRLSLHNPGTLRRLLAVGGQEITNALERYENELSVSEAK